jgi:hypothetical protein
VPVVGLFALPWPLPLFAVSLYVGTMFLVAAVIVVLVPFVLLAAHLIALFGFWLAGDRLGTVGFAALAE